MFTRPSRLLSVAAVTTLGLCVSAGLATAAPVQAPNALTVGPAPVEQRSASVATADALPTVQIDNGVVWTQTIVGDTVFAGGQFAQTRPAGAAPGTQLTPRGNLLAYSLSTGKLLTSFAPDLNGQVRSLAASPDGKRLYVGGQFTRANGVARFNLAAYDIATGTLVSTWKPAIGGSSVNAIVATNTTVYLGGRFTAANGVQRQNLAAVSASTGKTVEWAPTTDLQVDAMVMAPGGAKVVIGGRFAQVNGQRRPGLAALDPATGATTPFAVADSIINGGGGAGQNGGIYSLSTDGNAIYGTGWVVNWPAGGNLEGQFAALPNGDLKWINDCYGDSYGNWSDGTTVYAVSHAHDCSAIGAFPNKKEYHRGTATSAQAKGTRPEGHIASQDWWNKPAPAMVNWFPNIPSGLATGQDQGGWTITGSGDYVVVGGEFAQVNGKVQYGLVRFARPNVAPRAQAPVLSGATWRPVVAAAGTGNQVTVRLNWDRDDLNLTYRLIRDGDTARPIDTKTASSPFWQGKQTLTFADPQVAAGTHNYQVEAVDADGNVSRSDTVTISSPGTGVPPAGASVQDTFTRAVTADWGRADAGGTWTAAKGLAVSGGAGTITLDKGATRTTTLPATLTDTNLRADLGLNKVADGGGTYVSMLARKSSTGDYRAKVRVLANGSVSVGLVRTNGTTETTLAAKTVSGLTVAPGRGVSVRLRVTGSGPVNLQATAWATGSTEPTTPTVTASDATAAAITTAGEVGISAYASASVTNGPVVVTIDNLTADAR